MDRLDAYPSGQDTVAPQTTSATNNPKSATQNPSVTILASVLTLNEGTKLRPKEMLQKVIKVELFSVKFQIRTLNRNYESAAAFEFIYLLPTLKH